MPPPGGTTDDASLVAPNRRANRYPTPRRQRACAASALRSRDPAAASPGPPPFAIFASKVRPPDASAGTVTRAPLLNRLRTLPEATRLVTIVAPPGYGKTALLAQWAARDERPFAWLTADAHDAEPLVLLRHLAVALREIGAADRATFAALREPGPTLWSSAAPQLVSGLAACAHPFVLVLDSADWIPSGPAADLVAALADAVPAGSLLVVAARQAPAIGAARRRTGEALLELTARDLAFSPREVKLCAVAARPGLDDVDAGELHRRTEGWPAAIGLALRALADPDLADDLAEPVATERYIADYIRAELLTDLTDEQSAFLRRTAILDTHDGAALRCRARYARRGRTARGARARRPLPDPARPSGDVVPLPPPRRARRCGANWRIATRVRRTSCTVAPPRWYQRHGDRAAAVPFALASGDADRAAALITAIGMQLSATGRAATAGVWLDELAAAAPLEAYPAAAALGGWLHALAGRTRAERGLPGRG